MREHIIEPAWHDGVMEISWNLRSEDEREIQAASGMHPSDVLPYCINKDTHIWRIPPCQYGDNSTLVAVFGIDDHGAIGVPWMVATREIEAHQMYFLRRCRQIVNEWSTRWPLLTNCVDARNTLHIKWLKWAGFEFVELIPEWGAAKLPFWRFEKRKLNV